ncbi:hypothetical protein JXJ21_09525 [candidate division KSB1 bacterium]|nr:hypothetical protein [candidate division KSB1 bacterium]
MQNTKIKTIRIAAILFLGLGTIFGLIGALGDNPSRMWQLYLVNFLLWTGIAQSGSVFSATLEITNARWGKPMQKVAESLISFLPVSLLLLIIMLAGAEHIFPWLSKIHIGESKKIYLNLPFLFARNLIGMGLLTVLSFIFIKKRRQADEKGTTRPHALAVFLLLSYVVVYTIIAFDFVMSLSPHWYSTIMGMHIFTSCFYTGLAVITIIAVFGRWHLFPNNFMSDGDFHDIGKLTFGFALFWMSLLWSQYLVIWYGNIPEETEFLHLRFNEQPWATLTWMFIFLAFVIPFIILMNRKGKTNQIVSGTVGFLILIGSYIHFMVLVIPSLNPHHLTYGLSEILISVGFVGLFILSHDIGLKRFAIK